MLPDALPKNGFCTFTSRVSGRGNIFVASVCHCVSVCLSVWVITFEAVDMETSFLGVVVYLNNM